MILPNVRDKLLLAMEPLNPQQQWSVLQYAQSLNEENRGVSGTALVRFAGTIETEDLTAMKQAIETRCEQVDPNDW